MVVLVLDVISSPGNVSQGESICPGKVFGRLEVDSFQNAFLGDKEISTLDGALWKSIFEYSLHFLISGPGNVS